MLDIEKRYWRCSWLDLLRTFLALYVVFAHAVPWAASLHGDHGVAGLVSDWLNHFAQPISETNLAVLAFIVLSGYCIHRSGLGDGLSHFATRRAFRILPVYVAASILGVLVFLAVVPFYPSVKLLSGTESISGGCILAKLSTLGAISPSLGRCAFEGNAPLRTVAAEIWLYAAYPVGLLIIRRYGEGALWLLLAAIAIVGSAYAANTSATNWWHNDSFAGFLLYWWLGAKALDRRFVPLLWIVAPFALAAWITLSGDQSAFAVELRQLSVALMIAAALPLIDRPRESRATEILGRAGYSIYAFHAPIVYSAIAMGVAWQSALAVAAAFGLMGFYLIELPMDRRGREIAATAPERT